MAERRHRYRESYSLATSPVPPLLDRHTQNTSEQEELRYVKPDRAATLGPRADMTTATLGARSRSEDHLNKHSASKTWQAISRNVRNALADFFIVDDRKGDERKQKWENRSKLLHSTPSFNLGSRLLRPQSRPDVSLAAGGRAGTNLGSMGSGIDLSLAQDSSRLEDQTPQRIVELRTNRGRQQQSTSQSGIAPSRLQSINAPGRQSSFVKEDIWRLAWNGVKHISMKRSSQRLSTRTNGARSIPRIEVTSVLVAQDDTEPFFAVAESMRKPARPIKRSLSLPSSATSKRLNDQLRRQTSLAAAASQISADIDNVNDIVTFPSDEKIERITRSSRPISIRHPDEKTKSISEEDKINGAGDHTTQSGNLGKKSILRKRLHRTAPVRRAPNVEAYCRQQPKRQTSVKFENRRMSPVQERDMDETRVKISLDSLKGSSLAPPLNFNNDPRVLQNDAKSEPDLDVVSSAVRSGDSSVSRAADTKPGTGPRSILRRTSSAPYLACSLSSTSRTRPKKVLHATSETRLIYDNNYGGNAASCIGRKQLLESSFPFYADSGTEECRMLITEPSQATNRVSFSPDGDDRAVINVTVDDDEDEDDEDSEDHSSDDALMQLVVTREHRVAKRRKLGQGPFGSILGYKQRRSRLDANVLKQIDMIEADMHRPFFTYWVTFVQIVCFVVAVSVSGFSTFGFSVTVIQAEVLTTSLSARNVTRKEIDNMWGGPRQADLIHLGARYTLCMRRDERLYNVQLKDLDIESETACCVFNDGSGCVQTSSHSCGRLLSTWKKWNGTNNIEQRKSGTVCGQDPRLCTNPQSFALQKWPDDITAWPVCLSTRNKSDVPPGDQFRHMKYDVIGRPCCVGIQGQCVIVTREHCTFLRGYFHEEAALCAQINCIEEVCGMMPFLDHYHPNQFYRVFTSLFLHAGIIQLAITCVVQVTIMRNMEKLLGWTRMSLIYLFSGIGGSIGSALLLPYHVQVGPSGCQFGLLASVLVEVLHSWRSIHEPGVAVLKLCAIFFVCLGVGVLPLLDNFAHIFGFLFGFLLSFALTPFYTFNIFDSRQKVIGIVICLTICVGMLVAFFVIFYQASVVTSCSWCQYFNCVPFRDDFCNQEEVEIIRISIE